MATQATLTPTPIPAGDTLGGMPMVLYHVQINPASGAGTYLFAHGLQWTPTFVYVAKVLAEGIAPAATDMAVPCYADVGGTNIGVNVGSNGLYDVFYGALSWFTVLGAAAAMASGWLGHLGRFLA